MTAGFLTKDIPVLIIAEPTAEMPTANAGLFFMIFLTAQVAIFYYVRVEEVANWILTTYITAAITATFTAGFGWIQIMLSRFTKVQRRKSLYIMGLYAIGSLLFTWIGWAFLMIFI